MEEGGGYTLAEYLHQHGVNDRKYIRVPEPVWQAALEYIDEDDLAGRLADALYRVGDAAAAEEVASRALVYAVERDFLVDLHWTLAQCRMRAGRSTEYLSTLHRTLASPGVSARQRARLLLLVAVGPGHP